MPGIISSCSRYGPFGGLGGILRGNLKGYFKCALKIWQIRSDLESCAGIEVYNIDDPDAGKTELTLLKRDALRIAGRLQEPFSQSLTRLTTDACKTLVPNPPIVPKGEALRRAVAWLAEQGSWTADLIDQASQRFDLSPTEEEFLLQESRRFHQQDVRPTRDR